MLYQGEDVTIKIGGDEIVDLVSNDFIIYLYPYDKTNANNIVFTKSQLTRVDGENAYLLVIPHTTTVMMSGAYSMEILLIKDGDKRSIYKKDGLFTIDYSRIGNHR